MEPDDFLALISVHLPESDRAVVAGASIAAPETVEGPSLLAAWLRFERGLRNALVRLRASRKSQDPDEYVRRDSAGEDDTGPLHVQETAREAFASESPLSGEDALNQARWAFLDEIEPGHYFDLERIVIHYLRLQILARRRLFSRREGEERFNRLRETIMNQYYQENA